MLENEKTDRLQDDAQQRTDGGTNAQSVSGDYTGPEQPEDGNLPEDVVTMLKEVCTKMVQREKMARLQQVARCQRARMFARGLQYLTRNDENGLYVSGDIVGTPGWKKFDPASNSDPHLVINIHQAYGKIHVTNFSQSVCGVRFEPNDPNAPSQVEAAKEADAMRKIVSKINDQKALQSEIAYLGWTDGTVILYSRNVEDGSKFGVDATGAPRSYPEIETGGLLEWKLPIASKSFDDWDYALNQREYPLTVAKNQYKQKRDQIKSSEGGLGGDADLSRQARISVQEGLSLGDAKASKYQSGDSAALNVTRSRFHLRQSAFEELDDTKRTTLEKYFPSGSCVTFIGETYVESRDEDMNDHIVPYKAMMGDGFNVPGLGDILIDPQEWTNNLANNAKDCFDNTVPNKYFDQEMLKPESLANQTNQYGCWIPVNRNPALPGPVTDGFGQDEQVNLPPQLMAISQQLQGPLAQFLTGLQPAMFGGEMGEAGDTAQGYSQALSQAKAMMGLSWVPFKRAWAQVMRQCVKIAAESYGAGTILSTYVSGLDGKREIVVVHTDNLKGDFLAYPDTDENYPESTGAKKALAMQLITAGERNPALAGIVGHPDNLRMFKSVIGLDDFVIPGADSWDKQLREIEEMQKETPVPDPQAVQQAQQMATQNGLPMIPPDIAAQMPRIASVSVDVFDDNASELACCVWWLNSSTGQDAKRNKPSWYQNVTLHAQAHQKEVQANTPPPQDKPPSESINFKDLPPDGQVQLAAKAGLKIQPPPPPIVAPVMGAQP